MMKLLNIFRKNKENKGINALLSIPYDYTGYDIVFSEGKTEPELYIKINNIITNSKYNFKNIITYKNLTIESSNDEFDEFYDEWIEKLQDSKFVFHLDNSIGIEDFVDGINDMIKVNNYDFSLDKNHVVNTYKDKLRSLEIDSNYKYDILEANVVAVELRKYNIELIALFDGYDNCNLTIIPIDKIDELKELEAKIK